ncbi:hypothetical protein AVEN_120616-1 [Araneus ventricosus]|uniref:Uncharacterized protein n=1 Tax=Araneus ventricosus TaxID=182803 RepID=A0A4Y2QWT1_ARAVE|nr:hypothetical protein AVEN_120616-1 [Araneus ventricosus]
MDSQWSNLNNQWFNLTCQVGPPGTNSGPTWMKHGWSNLTISGPMDNQGLTDRQWSNLDSQWSTDNKPVVQSAQSVVQPDSQWSNLDNQWLNLDSQWSNLDK